MDHSVLFVDDDPGLLEFLKEVALHWPYTAYFADSAANGLQVLKAHEIHVVIADYKMPEQNGLEFLQELRTIYPDTIRIMMTGYADLQAVVDAINRGEVFRFVKKPFDPEQLRQLVDAAFREYRRKRARNLLLNHLEELQDLSEMPPIPDASDVCYLQLESIDGRIIHCNQAAERFTGLSGEEMKCKTLREILPGIDLPDLISNVKTDLRDFGVGKFRMPLGHGDQTDLYDIYAFRTNHDSPDEVTLILAPNTFVSQSELNLYNYVRELEDSAEIKDRGLQFLYEMSIKIGKTKSFEELAQTIFADLKEILTFDVGMLVTFSAKQTNIYVRSEYALDPETRQLLKNEIRAHYKGETGQDLPGPDLELRTKDWSGNHSESELPKIPASLKATLTLPLHSPEGEFIGLIFIGSLEEMSSSGDEIRLFATFVARIALVLHIINNILLFRQVREMAIKDSLTGLYNRRFFEEQITKELERARRFNNDLSVLLLDIDHFKRINDQYGHLNGDVVLKKIAEIIMSSTRSIDVSIRFGGEEFIMLLPETPPEGAKIIAERLRHTIETASFMVSNTLNQPDVNLFVTVSIGISHIAGKDQISAAQIIDQADQALYYAKSHGRNQVILYETSLVNVPEFTGENP